MPAVGYIILYNILQSFPEKLYDGLAAKVVDGSGNGGKRKMEKALEIWVLSPARLPGKKSKSFKQGAHLHSTADV